MRTDNFNCTCEDCQRFGAVGHVTHEQTGFPPHEPIEVCACWPGGGCEPRLAERLDSPCALFVARNRRCPSGGGPTRL